MAKISLLPALNDPNGTELVPVVKDGKTMRASVAGLVAGAVAGTVDNLKVDAVAYIGRPGDAVLVDGTPTGIGAIYWHDTVDDTGSVIAVDVFDRAAGTINVASFRGPLGALARTALTSFKTTGTRTSRRIMLAEPIPVRAGDILAVQPTEGALVVAEVQSGDVGYTYSAPYLPETVALNAPTTNGQVQVRFVIAYRKQVVTADTFLASTSVKIVGQRAVALSGDANPRGYVEWATTGQPTGHLVKWGNYTATLDAKAQRMEFPNFSLAQPYAFIGNSLTDSTDVTDRWSQLLAAQYGQLMISVARYSSDWRMVYRVGAKAIVLTLAGALPAAGTVAVSKINGAAIDGNNPAAFLTTGDPGVVSGMAMSGYLTRNGVTRRATVSAPNGASFAYVVTQAPGQTAITFDGPVTFVPDFALSVPGRICIIWLGNNYFFSGVANAYGDNTNPQMWVDLKLIVAFLQARGCRVLLLPIIPSANTAEGDNWLARGAGTPYTAMESANARTEAMFPGLMARHADGRTFLKFLQDRNDGSPEALDDVVKGFTPRNLRRKSDGSYDLLHMYGDGAGDRAVKDFVDSALQAQSLPSAITQTTDFVITALGAEGQLPDVAIARVGRDATADIADRTVNVAGFDPLLATRKFGEAAPAVQGASANAHTYIFDQAVPGPGRISEIRIAQTATSKNTVLKVKRFLKSGTMFTPVAGGETVVSIVAGNQTKPVSIIVQKDEYIGFYTGLAALGYVQNSAGSPVYWSAAGDIVAATDFTANSGGGVTRLMLGFDVSYLLVTDERVGAVEAKGTAVEKRTTVVEGVAAAAAGAAEGMAAATRLVQTVGVPASEGVSVVSAGAEDRVYVLAAPILGSGSIRAMRIAIVPSAPAAGVLVRVQRWGKVGGTFTKIAEKMVIALPGANTIALGMPVAKGDLIGIYSGASRLSYTVGSGIPYFRTTGALGNVATFDATADSGSTVRLELSFDVDYFPVTPAIVGDVAIALAKGAANEGAIADVAVKRPLPLFDRPKNASGAWTGVSGGFKRWRAGVLGTNIPAGKLITRWVVTAELTASVDNVRAMLFSRPIDANVDVVSMVNDTALWAAEMTVAKTSLAPIAAGSIFYEIPFAEPIPFAADQAKAYYIRFYGRDASGANVVIGCGQATATSSSQLERGLYNANDTDAAWNVISAASGFSTALRVETDAYQVRKSALPDVGGSVLPELVSTPVVTLASPSALSTSVTGYFRQGGANTPIATTLNYPAAAAGKERVDLIVMNRANAAISTVAGTERTAQIDSMEWMGTLPANSILLGRTLVSETKAIAVNTSQFRSLIRIGSEGEYLAHVARNNRLLRRTLGKIMRGLGVKLGGLGDSITGLQGGGVPPYTANGDSRDRIGYLGNYPADIRAKVQLFNLGRGVTDNVKIGWNWAIKAALDAIAGAEVVQYLNYGIGGTTSAATASATNDGRDNGLYPPRIAVPLAAGLDLIVIAFGMNERGSGATYGNLLNMIAQFQAVGTDVVLMGCPRPHAANSMASWLVTERAIEAAALDGGAAYVSVKMMAEDQFLGAIGLPAEALGATNINIAGNHPGLFELAQYGRACVSQLGL